MQLVTNNSTWAGAFGNFAIENLWSDGIADVIEASEHEIELQKPPRVHFQQKFAKISNILFY